MECGNSVSNDAGCRRSFERGGFTFMISSRRWWADAKLIAAIAAAAALRLWDITGYEFWADETHTQLLAEFSVGDLCSPGLIAPYTPLYFLLTHAVSSLCGRSVLLRLLPVIFGVLFVPLIHRVTTKLGFEKSAPVAAWLAAVNPLLVYFGREHRMYSLYVVLMGMSLLFAIKVMNSSENRPTVGTALSATGAFLTFPFSALYFPALAVLVYKHERKSSLLAAFALPCVVVALWSGAMLAANATGGNDYYQPLTAHMLLVAVKNFVAGNFSMEHRELAAAAYAATVLSLAATASAVYALRNNVRLLLFFLLYFFVPFGLIRLAQFFMGDIYNYKSLMPSVIAVLIMVSIGCSRLDEAYGRLRIGSMLFLALCCLNLFVDRALLDRAHRYNWTTPRTIGFASVIEKASKYRDSFDGVISINSPAYFYLMYHGGVPGTPIYMFRDRFMGEWPAMNRASIKMMAERCGIVDITIDTTHRRLICLERVNPNVALPMQYEIVVDSPAPGFSMLLGPITPASARAAAQADTESSRR